MQQLFQCQEGGIDSNESFWFVQHEVNNRLIWNEPHCWCYRCLNCWRCGILLGYRLLKMPCLQIFGKNFWDLLNGMLLEETYQLLNILEAFFCLSSTTWQMTDQQLLLLNIHFLSRGVLNARIAWELAKELDGCSFKTPDQWAFVQWQCCCTGSCHIVQDEEYAFGSGQSHCLCICTYAAENYYSCWMNERKKYINTLICHTHQPVMLWQSCEMLSLETL